MTFERTAHGRSGSPVSSTMAAEVSSQDVSIPRMSIRGSQQRGQAQSRTNGRRRLERALQRFGVGWTEDAAFGNDAGDQLARRHVESRIPDQGSLRRELTAP